MIIQIAKPVLEQKKLYLITKRAFDIVCSFLGLLILAIPMIIIALIITLDSPGPPIFKQERLGLHGKPFMIYKFRSMRLDAEENGPQWADEQDPRCTHFGQILRRTRLDELPQFYNILRGDMSFVGPRPEVADYVDLYTPYQRQVLQVRPGITGLASIRFRNENDLLTASDDPNRTYIEQIMPKKIELDLEYIPHASVFYDIKLIIQTFAVVIKE